MAENDDFFPPDAGKALEREAAGDGQGRGRDRPPRHRSCLHGARTTRWALVDEEKAEEIWPEVVDFLHEAL